MTSTQKRFKSDTGGCNKNTCFKICQMLQNVKGEVRKRREVPRHWQGQVEQDPQSSHQDPNNYLLLLKAAPTAQGCEGNQSCEMQLSCQSFTKTTPPFSRTEADWHYQNIQLSWCHYILFCFYPLSINSET